ncbi:MAG TPA: WD40 repeat domain-containing serine/threonine-protein kinase, partial [bacterium]|nr:WD40 repeat domain-containing serine/threonine-protein kinase [bacterium]
LAAEADDAQPLAIWESPRGNSLDRWIAQGTGRPPRQKPAEVVPLFLALADALHQAHGVGFFFNWLRPDATWFWAGQGPSGHQIWFNNLQLAQFPGAGRVDPQPPVDDLYGSPERLAGSPSVGSTEDLYALGAMAYQALTGFLPYEDEVLRELGEPAQPEFFERLKHLRIYRDAPADPRAIDQAIPAALADTVMALLHRDPAIRPSAGTVVQRLEPLLPAGAKLKRAATATLGSLAAVPQRLGVTAPPAPMAAASVSDLRKARSSADIETISVEFDQVAREPLPNPDALGATESRQPLSPATRRNLLLGLAGMACAAALVLASPFARPPKEPVLPPKPPPDLALLFDVGKEIEAPKPQETDKPEPRPKPPQKDEPKPDPPLPPAGEKTPDPSPAPPPDPTPEPETPPVVTPAVVETPPEEKPQAAAQPQPQPTPEPIAPEPAPRPKPDPEPDRGESVKEPAHPEPTPRPAPAPAERPAPEAPIAGPINPQPAPAGPPEGPKPLPKTPDGALFDFSANEQQTWSVDISPDGRTIATGGSNEHAQLFDIRNGSNQGKLSAGPDRDHNNWVTAVAFNRNGRLLATGSEDTYVKLWDVAHGKRLLYTLKSPGDATVVRALAFDPSADVVYVGYGNSSGSIKILDAGALKERPTKLKHGSVIRAMAVSPDGRLLLTGGEDHKARLWNTRDGSLVATLEGHGGWVQAVAFNGKGLLATGSSDAKVRVWNTQGDLVQTLPYSHKGGVYSVAFRQSDGRLLASGGNDGTVRLWDVTFKAEQGALKGHLGIVTSLAFSPNGKELVTATLQDLHDRRTNPNIRVYRVY